MASTSVTFSGLVLHYTCDDTVTTDTSGNNNTGILAGSGTTLSAGLINNKLTFNGSGYITFTSAALLGLATVSSEKSISCWVNTTQGNATILSLRGPPYATFNLVIGDNTYENVNTGKLAVIVRDDGGGSPFHFSAGSGAAINDGNWHHVVWTRNSAQLNNLYIDGALVTGVVDTILASMTPDIASSAIGYERVTAKYPLTGSLDDFQIYNRALTASEVTSIYGGGRGFSALSANSGAFAFTGVAAAPLPGRVLQQTTVGTFTTTGIAAGGLSTRILQAPVVSFRVIRNDIALQRTGASAMAANTGVFAFTPTDTGLLFAHVMPAVAGAFTLNGINAGRGGTYILSAASGAFVFTGQPAAGLHSVASITMSPGSFVFTGIWVVFNHQRVFPGIPPPIQPGIPGVSGVLNMGRKVWIRPGRWC